MKRLERLEKQGWKITTVISTGNVHAIKDNGLTRIIGSSITAVYKRIFGY